MHLVVAARDLSLRIDESGGVVHQILAAAGRVHSDAPATTKSFVRRAIAEIVETNRSSFRKNGAGDSGQTTRLAFAEPGGILLMSLSTWSSSL